MKYLPCLISLLFLVSCNSRPVNKDEKPLARVYGNYLYLADIQDVIPAGVDSADSVTIARDFIEKWIRNQLILSKAEVNLTDAEKDVRLQMENYRSSLLIYAYQQSYLRQKLDTVVTDSEIEAYYNENKSNFILGESMFKGLFIKVPAKAPEIWKVRQWYRSEDAESVKSLEGYCYNHATVFDDFDEKWIKLSEVLRMIPEPGAQNSIINGSRKNLEIRDNDYFYFLNAKEIASEGTVSPFELVKNDIHYIILNKRKIMLINELEQNIYSDAQNHEYFTIYQ